MNPPMIHIIDDDHDIVDAMETILQMESYRTSHSFTGKQGLLETQKIRPDLLLLDYMLPDMNGEEIAHSLRGNSDINISSIPIVLISASKEAEKIAEEMSLKGFIEKPFDLENFLEVIRGAVA